MLTDKNQAYKLVYLYSQGPWNTSKFNLDSLCGEWQWWKRPCEVPNGAKVWVGGEVEKNLSNLW